ncbi:alpha-2-macroglobulin family protein [Leptospira ilyithenensis]|uniref:Peptidase n=1 Tax=Leptospira ilyithenensis TaxID=2484901 RepID=A0A4R9LQ11_9LEPT|nr:MG2 domain-containing protein [Leptospira ilyithenensis]TGN10066.1 peptidase [Leptospira ilyithenensis]
MVNRTLFRKFFLLASLFVLTTTSFFSQNASPHIELFSPEGTSKQVKQIQVRFSKPIVTLGDPRPKQDIFKINCALPGIARWIDSSTWVYEFEKELPGGVKCDFTLNDSVKTLEGQNISGQKNFLFDTGGPSILYASPYSGGTVDEDQIFILNLDAKPDLNSVLRYAYFTEQDLSNRIGLEIVEGKSRIEILKSQYSADVETTILIKAKQTFLPEKNIQLVWGKGVRSSWGGEIREDEIHNFKVRAPFSVSFSCERVNAKADCIPILPFSLYFSGAVPTDELSKISLTSKSGKEYPSKLDPEDKNSKSSHYLSFAGPFPENEEFVIQIPKSLKDETDRELVNQSSFPLTVRSGEFPPLAKFPAKFGILELNANPAIPVTVRNIEAQLPLKTMSLTVTSSTQKTIDPIEVQKWFQALSKHEREKSIFASKIVTGQPVSANLPKPNGKKTMEVVGIPLEKPGFYVVELASDVLGASLLEKKGKMYVTSGALVTNMSVHFKWGRESSLVWVTSLDKAAPEPGVIVKIIDCKGIVRGTGITGKEGTVRFGKMGTGEIPYCGYYEMGSGLSVFARKGEDLSFTSTNWDKGIESWRYQLPTSEYNDSSEIQTVVMDRTLFRAGETVHFKHFRRGHSIQGMTASDPKLYPKKVVIQHEGSGEKFVFPLVWSFPGSTESEFAIPKQARLGTYKIFYPYSEDDDSYGNTVASFRVEEFRLPVLRGGIQLSEGAGYLVAPNNAKVEMNLQYLSGGGASGFPVTVRGQVTPQSFSVSEEYSEFSFFPEKIETGRVVLDEEGGGSDESSKRKTYPGEKINLDEKGFSGFTFDDLNSISSDSSLEVEMEYLDPSGEIQTAYRSFPIYSANLRIGIMPKGWMFTKEKVEMQILALDLKNQPKKNQKVTVKAYSRSYYSNRRRLVGGYYAYDHYREVKDLGTFCTGKTNEKGILFCDSPAPATGEILFSASSEDEKGNVSASTHSIWVASSEESWFEASDHNRMDILPEKRNVETGETLKVQLRSPFREATALVTIEREGIMDSFVMPVTGKEPTVSFPIKKEYSPNIYVSVLLIRGRIGDPKPTALVDLARPSFRMGIVPIHVGWKPYELSVNVKTKNSSYKVREKVEANIQVKDANGKPPQAGGELVVAVVDEALLELSGNPTWKLLDAMMGLRGHEVNTSTGQSQVIGRRHFGLKARPTGGGGGKSPTRSLFDTLLYWKGKVVLDKEGRATVNFPLNDSLSSFKIVAVASSGVSEFGTGSVSIQSTQDVQIFSGVPSVVREGDSILHEYSVRNATSSEKKITAKLSVTDIGTGSAAKKQVFVLPEKTLSLRGSATGVFAWDLKVPNDLQTRNLFLEVKDDSGTVLDRIAVDQKVTPNLVQRVYQAGLFQWEGEFKENIETPSDSIPGSGFFQVTTSSSILGSQKAVEDYFKKYPYNCLEQKVSTAIGLSSESRWKQIDSELGSYLDSNGLVKYFPRMERGSEILTAYVLTSSKLADFEMNGDSVTKMVGGLRAFLLGNIQGDRWSFGADSVIRKIIVMEALSRYETLEWDLVSPVFVNIELLPTASLIDLGEILTRVSGYDPKLKSRIASALRSRLNLQGTELVIADANFSNPWWILGSNDYTMSKLVLWSFADPFFKKDMPRLVKGLTQKQKKGRWDTTLGNAYGILALKKAGKVLESERVQGGNVSVSDGKSVTLLDPNASDKSSASVPMEIGKKEIAVGYSGKGKPWIFWEAKSKIPLKEPLFSGYRIKRSVEAVSRVSSGKWTKGDILKIRLEITADSEKTWVVLEDPIPAGSVHIGRGLGKESKILSGRITNDQDFSPSFEERSFTNYRAYYEYLPQGTWVTEYTIQLNHPGIFPLPPTRVEAMYSPETFAESPNGVFEISGSDS